MKILIFLDRVLPLLFWILISFAFDLAHVAVLTGIAAVIHELGHMLRALRLTGRASLLTGRISGPKLKLGELGYREELLILAGGPSANLFAAAAALPCLFLSPHPYIVEFATVNLLTALSNLMPIQGFDGYKILFCLATKSKNALRIQDILYTVSFIFSAVLALFMLYLMLKLGEGYWGFVLFLSIIISEIKKRDRQTI